MNQDRLLTVAIHTYDKALELKSMLEYEGIAVELHNVNLSSPEVASGVRVRIKETDLPLALRVIENSEIFIMPEVRDKNDNRSTVLVPVDFSSYSMQACKLAFSIAARHKGNIKLLHAYPPPASINMQLTAALDFGNLTRSSDTIAVEESKQLSIDAQKKFEAFTAELKALIKSGEIPPVKFSTDVVAAVPEEAILEAAKQVKPMIIVMGTRGANKKERELIGSVTAEVLDSCRQPVFTVPELSKLTALEDIKDVVVISNLDQNDMLALDALMRLVPETVMNVHIIHIAGKHIRGKATPQECEMLLEYCRTHYPVCNFSMESLETSEGANYLKNLNASNGISLIVVPNRKKNILARLFNPNLAHRLLFHADIPLMAIPV